MEIYNVALNYYIAADMVLPAIAFDYIESGDDIEVELCDPIYVELPYELKLKVSFATYFISKNDFKQLTGIIWQEKK